jgi:DeoR/GlpR family transcriptional regulator of sugar metabolism
VETTPPRGRASKASVRQRQILDLVVSRHSCSAQDLAQAFDVSLMTIHRDLDELERRGVVRKFHGGVTAMPSAVFEAQMSFRIAAHPEEKEKVAQAALRHVEAGSAILLDDSSTVLPMVPGLADLAPLHVATSCMTTLRQLADISDVGISVIGLGGDYDPMHDAFVGTVCLDQIAGLRVDAFFMSTSAVKGAEAFHQEARIVAVKRAMMRVATRRYLVVDGSKFGRVALHKVAPLTDFDLVICDSSTSAEHLRELDTAGVAYEIA